MAATSLVQTVHLASGPPIGRIPKFLKWLRNDDDVSSRCHHLVPTEG